MALPKLFSRKQSKGFKSVLVKDLDQHLDVATDRFPALARRLARQFARHRALLDLADYRLSRRLEAAETADSVGMARSNAATYTLEVRRLVPMDREEEFKMARRHEFMQRVLVEFLTQRGPAGDGLAEDAVWQLLRQPAAEILAAVPARAPRGVDAEWLAAWIGTFEELRNLYVEGALHIVLGTVHRYRGLGVDTADLIQEGNASLFQAIDGFDWRRDVRFRTYAQFWVQQAVLKMLYNHARTVRVPIWVQKVLGKIRRVQEAGRRSSRSRLAAAIASTPKPSTVRLAHTVP